jgi:hypothetical protein
MATQIVTYSSREEDYEASTCAQKIAEDIQQLLSDGHAVPTESYMQLKFWVEIAEAEMHQKKH